MHILYFYQFYNTPDAPAAARHYRFFQTLGQRHRITVVTTPAYLDARITDDFDLAPPGVTLRLLDVPYNNAMGTGPRLWAYAAYAIKAVLAGLLAPRPDLIYAFSPPLTAAWAARMTASARRIPWIFEVNDLWPDFPIQMGAMPNTWLQQRLYALEHALYRSAAHVIALSPDIEDHVLGCGLPPERVTTLVHGSEMVMATACCPDRLDALRHQHGLRGKDVVIYGGTFGRANDISTLIATAERLADRDDLRFVFAGYGFHESTLRAAAKRLSNIVLLPPQPLPAMMCWFKLADLSLVSFIDKPALAANSPHKFFDSLTAGTPVLVTSSGWTRRFVEEHGCGWHTPPSDPATLARRIVWALDHPEERAEAGRRGAAVAREQFDRAVLARRLETIFEDVVARKR